MSVSTKKPTRKVDKPSKEDRSQTEPNSGILALADSNQEDAVASLRSGLDSISNQIISMKNELKTDLKIFKEEIASQMKNELSGLKADMDQKMAKVTREVQDQGERMEENLTSTEEIEAWSTETHGVLQEIIREQSRMKDRLDDYESRSRRNNLRIYGIPEDTEDGSVPAFVERWLRAELGIDMDLQIQRAHRAIAARPKAGDPPRSLIVNFLQHTTKELVLSKVWGKKNTRLGGSRIHFDHDYSQGVLQKRKAYANVKAELKKRDIRFQTPFTKMRIHWANGKKTYDSAEEAAEDLRKRGMQVETSDNHEGPTLAERLQTTGLATWLRVGRDGTADMGRRARQRLKEFQCGSNGQGAENTG